VIEYRFAFVSSYLFAIAGSNPFAGHIPCWQWNGLAASAHFLPVFYEEKQLYALHPKP
jgi:hypothetical protein